MFTGNATAQTPGILDWGTLGLADDEAIVSGTTVTSAGVTGTLTFSTVTDGGSFIPEFGDDFLSYETGTRGGITGLIDMGFDNDAQDQDDKIIVDVVFSQAVQNVQFTLMDIDQGTFDDFVEVYFDTGSGFINAKTGSFATLGGASVIEDNETFGDGWEGDGGAASSSAEGNLILNFGIERIVGLQIVYFSGVDGSGVDPGRQVLGLSDITFETIAPTADLELTKTVNNQFPIVGNNVTYTLTLTNNGPEAATNVVVEDILPSGVSYVTDDGGTAYDEPSGAWTIPGSLASGASQSLNITATVLGSGSYVNLSEVIASDQNDVDSTPNNSSTTTFEDDTDIVTIFPGSSPPSCPAGQSVANQIGNATSVATDNSVSNETRALGPLAPPGTTPPDSTAAELNASSDLLALDLGIEIPLNSLVTFSMARDGGSAGNATQVDIAFSTDNINYTSAGVYGAAPADYTSVVQDELERFVVPSSVSGARYIQFDNLNGDDAFIDAVEYGQICTTSPVVLSAVKEVSIIATNGGDLTTCASAPDPATNDQHALPGACIEYQISVTHPGGSQAHDIEIADTLPNNLTYAGSSLATFLGGTLRTTDTAATPNNITCTGATIDCTVRLEGASLSAGETGTLSIRALIE